MLQRMDADGGGSRDLIQLYPPISISSVSETLNVPKQSGGGSPIIEFQPQNPENDMSILRKIGKTVGRVALQGSALALSGTPLGPVAGIGARLLSQQRPNPPQPPAVMRVAGAAGPMIPSNYVPGTSFFAPAGPGMPPPPMRPAGPTAPPTRPTFGGPGFVQTAGAAIVGRFLSLDLLKRLASIATSFAAAAGYTLGFDAILEMLKSPVDLLPQDSMNFLQQFGQSNEFAQFQMMLQGGGDPRFGPMVLPAGKKTIKDAPRGYVIVMDPVSGEEVAMRKDVARARGLYKSPTKPPISAREWKSAMSFKRVQKKLDKYYKLTAPKTKTVFKDAKSKRCR